MLQLFLKPISNLGATVEEFKDEVGIILHLQERLESLDASESTPGVPDAYEYLRLSTCVIPQALTGHLPTPLQLALVAFASNLLVDSFFEMQPLLCKPIF